MLIGLGVPTIIGLHRVLRFRLEAPRSPKEARSSRQLHYRARRLNTDERVGLSMNRRMKEYKDELENNSIRINISRKYYWNGRIRIAVPIDSR